MTELIKVTEVAAPHDASLPESGDVMLYPEDVHKGRGVYPLAVADVADELEADGLIVRTAHDDDEADYYGDREGVVLAIVIGIVSSAAWEGIKLLLTKRKGKRVKLTVGYRQSGEVKWVQAEGDAADVAEALSRLN
jgi:hypothetical protein